MVMDQRIALFFQDAIDSFSNRIFQLSPFPALGNLNAVFVWNKRSYYRSDELIKPFGM